MALVTRTALCSDSTMVLGPAFITMSTWNGAVQRSMDPVPQLDRLLRVFSTKVLASFWGVTLPRAAESMARLLQKMLVDACKEAKILYSKKGLTAALLYDKMAPGLQGADCP